ncbi:MAG TPA: universal stress protein [Anaerolineae bacterium]|nr:universal stress protein [Caldilineae bacterium]HID33104.1 universal stress protein [Anaerolineae bacterium]
MDQLKEAGVEPVSAEYVYRPPAATIVNYAQERRADLIVLGAQGLHPHQYQVGGVVRKVINRSPISCLLVR